MWLYIINIIQLVLGQYNSHTAFLPCQTYEQRRKFHFSISFHLKSLLIFPIYTLFILFYLLTFGGLSTRICKTLTDITLLIYHFILASSLKYFWKTSTGIFHQKSKCSLPSQYVINILQVDNLYTTHCVLKLVLM